jgi:hypothetical protein
MLNVIASASYGLTFHRSPAMIGSLVLALSAIAPAASVAAEPTLEQGFANPPDSAKPRVYWWWLFNRVDKDGITRDLEEFKAKGISGVNMICTGGYAGLEPLPGVKAYGPEWWELFRHAVKEAKRLDIEFGFNLSAGGWTMEGPWVTPEMAMKKVVHADLKFAGPKKFSDKLPQPETVDGYYRDYCVQAFPQSGDRAINPGEIIDLTDKLQPDGRLEWEAPAGEWTILRTGYTLTGTMWSKWHAYPTTPQADTFEGGDGYEIDYLNAAALDDHFEHLGKPILEAAKQAGGRLAYLWSDSWECGKLTWTQDFPAQFRKFRGYDLAPYLPALKGYTVAGADVTARFRADFDRTIQDCVAENFYGHFGELCHAHGMTMGSEAAGPNDIPPQDALRNLGRCDIPAGEFWVNGHYNAPGGYNDNRGMRLNLKQTASAAHIYGRREAQAESFTQQEPDRTHWSLGPAELKPYANDAFCEGINRIMLHQATCQPPSDGKPGYEFCAGQHWNPNMTWWEQSPAFFTYLSRCSFMLQQGNAVGDVCFYLGEEPPTLAPPKYLDPSLGPGYDCDYCNADVLLTRMAVKDGRIVLPDGTAYRLLVLQNCTSTSPEICREVSAYQNLPVSNVPSKAMSLPVIEKLRDLIRDGAVVIGAPPEKATGLKDYPKCDEAARKIAAEIWGELDGKTRTERRFGRGRVIWGKSPKEILAADGVKPDFSFVGQAEQPRRLDFIHRTSRDVEIYFVINRTNQPQKLDCTFRVAGRQPELWNAVTSEIRRADAFHQIDECTTLPLEFPPFGSCFVIFRQPIASDAAGKADHNYPQLAALQTLGGPWTVAFDPQWGGPASAEFSELTSWTKRPEEGIKFYSGKATYRKTFVVPTSAGTSDDRLKAELRTAKMSRLFLDLGDVKEVAEVRLNGKKLGVLWSAPWRVEITDAVKAGDNTLEIDVVNLWANRVIGDLSRPKEQRFTKTHDAFRFNMITKDTPLLDAGLLGSVNVLGVQNGNGK